MLYTKIIAQSLAMVGLLAATAASQAAVTVYTTQASFLAAVLNPGTDTFAGFSLDVSTPGPLNRSAGSYGYVAITTPNNAFFGAGTSGNPWLSTNQATDIISFGSFTGGVAGLGGNIFGSNIAGAFALADLVVTATDASGTVTRTITAAPLSGFIGFASSTGSLSTVTVASVPPVGGGFLWPTVDNLVLAAASVPLPDALFANGFE